MASNELNKDPLQGVLDKLHGARGDATYAREISEPDYWIWTGTRKFSYNYTQPEQIDIEDIAHNLALVNRYVGSVKVAYCVADHCCNLVEYCESKGWNNPIFLLGVLLHDAAEAYLSDIPAPAKKLLPDFKRLEKRIYGHIASKFGAPNDEDFHEHLDRVDKNIVRDEAELLFDNVPDWVEQYTKLGATITISKHAPDGRYARERYLELFWELQEKIQEMGYDNE